MLRKLRTSGKRKAGLAAVFCCTVITMVIAIVRIGVVSPWIFQADLTWCYLWSIIEICAGMSRPGS